jgi:Trypsin-like peptidase domain/MAP3K TRAFs-binding domain
MESSYLEDLQAALDTFNWKQAERLSEAFIDELNLSTTPYDEQAAKKVLKALRRKRQFRLMGLVADAFIRAGQSAAEILRQYGQSMVDQGNLTASRMVLQSIIDDAGSPPEEKAEARGLIGRIYKQLYVNAGDASNPRQQQNLSRAIEYYCSVYKSDPKSFLWQGINIVALLARAERDHVVLPALPPMRGIAQEIDAFLKKTGSLKYWDRATAVENAVALGDFTGAYDHALYYVLDKEADAFEIASLLRQLTEVWQLTEDTEPGNTLLPVLRSGLLKRLGGQLTVDADKVRSQTNNAQSARKRLEKVFGTERYQPLAWLQTALQRCASVARVDSVMNERVGTGFLVKASDFFAVSNKSELLFLTNAHVISPEDKPFPGAMPPQAAKIAFEANDTRHEINELVWSSPPTELDATFLTLKSPDPSAECCPLIPAPSPFNIETKPRVYVIGYPLSAGLSISLLDSSWLDTDGRLLHYRTPTEPGSSGSPVFDQQYWTLIGLHHAGEKDMPRLRGIGSYEANEGIAIDAIRKATQSGVLPKQ